MGSGSHVAGVRFARGGPDGGGENDNTAMMFFLKDRVEVRFAMSTAAVGTGRLRVAAVSDDPAAPAADAGSSTPVLMPELGESVTEGTVTRWLKKVGERVEVDEPLLEVSTDKVDTEIPAPAAGVP